MRVRSVLCWLVAVAGLACTCPAQDSISRNANGGNGMPGDALNPWTTGGPQRVNYVVDLSTITGSWGTPFGIAPIVKSGKVSPDRFTAVNGPSAISARVRPATPGGGAFTLWTAPQGGVHTTENNTALNSAVFAPSSLTTFGVGLLDFDEVVSVLTLVLTNQAYGAIVGYSPSQAQRLYVTRTVAAVNSPVNSTDRSQFGLGAVDAAGNLLFRADGFQAASPVLVLAGENYFRVKTATRNTALINLIDSAGGADAGATDRVLNNSAVLHAAPTAIPSDQAGRSVVVGANFLGQLVSETAVNTTTTTAAHRPSTTDHRGSPSYSAKPLFAGSIGTGAMLVRSSAGGGVVTDAISVFGLASSGAVSGAATFQIPTSITDNAEAFAWPVSGGDFRQYDSQALFRGGVGPVAVGQDYDGRGLAGAVVYNGATIGSNSPINAIAVARFDPTVPSPPASWTLAAWVATAGADGKDISGDFGADGAPGTADAGEGDGVIDGLDAPIGRLASLSEGASGLVGPSISAPAFDAAGNIYFAASVALKKKPGAVVVDEFKVALLRGVYDPALFAYRLEVLLEPGTVVPGANSGRNYRVEWLGLADGDSISSAALWSGNLASQAWNGMSFPSLATNRPQHLGGLVVSSRVVYDADNNGTFEDPTAPAGNAASVDEAYNVVLYIGNVLDPCNDIDFNNDEVFPDISDLNDFLLVFSGGPCSTASCDEIDFNNDGVFPDSADLTDFLRVFSGGPCLP